MGIEFVCLGGQVREVGRGCVCRDMLEAGVLHEQWTQAFRFT